MAATPSIAILGTPGSWHAEALCRSCRQTGLTGTVVTWPELAATVGNGPPQFQPHAVATATAVVVRGMPTGSLEQVITRMDVLGQLAATGHRVLNRPTALETAIDKYLTSARLHAAGLPVPRTTVIQSATALRQFAEACGGTAIVKPLFGSNGKGLTKFSVETTLLPEPLSVSGIALAQEPIDNEGWDVRMLVVGESVYAMKRVAPAGDWRTNIALGGQPEPFTPPADWIALARQAAAAVDTELAGVDLLPARDGSVWLLEVNAVPGWRALQTVTPHDIAAAVVELAVTGAG